MQGSTNDDGCLCIEKKRRGKKRNPIQSPETFLPKHTNAASESFQGDAAETNHDEELILHQKRQSYSCPSSPDVSCSHHDVVALLKDEIQRKDLLIEKLCSGRDMEVSSAMALPPYPVADYKPQLERIIADQNLVIQELQINYIREKDRAIQLDSELNFLKHNEIKVLEKEVEELNTRLIEKDRDLRERFTESIRKKFEEEYIQKFDAAILEIQKKKKDEQDKLEVKFTESVSKLITEHKRNDYTLMKEIDFLRGKIEELVKSGLTFEIAPLSADVENIRKSLNAASLDGASRQNLDKLSSALANEITLKAEIDSLRKLNNGYILEIDGLNKRLNESVSENEMKFTDLEHTLDVCNHDKEKLIAAVGQISEQNKSLHSKYKELLIQFDEERSFSKENVLSSLQPLHSLAVSLKKDLSELAVTFSNKIASKNLAVPEVSMDDVMFPMFEEVLPVDCPDVKEISLVLKECHLQRCNLQKVLKLFECNLDFGTKETQRLMAQLKNFRELSKQKENHFECQVKQLNRQLEDRHKEKSDLERKLIQAQSSSVPREEYQQTVAERNRLAAQVNELTISEELPVANYDVLASEPSGPSLGSAHGSVSLVSRESIIAWAEACHRLELDNCKLKQQLSQAGVALSEAQLTRKVLDEEVAILKADIDCFKVKISDYLEVKERCLVLENERDLLDFKMKHILNQLPSDEVKEQTSFEMEQQIITQQDDGANVYSSKVNLLQELVSKNRKVVIAEERLAAAEREVVRSKLKLVNSDELVKSLQEKVDCLLMMLQSEQTTCQQLSEKNAELVSKVKMHEVEAECMKSQLELLKSQTQSESSSLELLEKIRVDSLSCLKRAVEKMNEAERCRLEFYWEQPVKGLLDARQREEVLEKSNTQLQNEVERLHIKLADMQQSLHLYQNNGDTESLQEFEQLQRKLLEEIEAHRQQHARIEEALRSTGGLLNDLQQSKNLVRDKMREIMNLQKKVEEVKYKCNEMDVKIIYLETKAKEKDTLLQQTIDQKKKLEDKVSFLLEASASKEQFMNNKILQSQWEMKNCKIKMIANQVSKEVVAVEQLTAERLESLENHSHVSSDGSAQVLCTTNDYEMSVASLSRCWDADRAAILALSQSQLVDKVVGQ